MNAFSSTAALKLSFVRTRTPSSTSISAARATADSARNSSRLVIFLPLDASRECNDRSITETRKTLNTRRPVLFVAALCMWSYLIGRSAAAAPRGSPCGRGRSKVKCGCHAPLLAKPKQGDFALFTLEFVCLALGRCQQ